MRDTLGPVSAALAADLQDLTRQHGFVVWPDRPAPSPTSSTACFAAATPASSRSTSSPTAAASSS
jgi:hypothetical protein